jgi:hypothetical protein
VCVRCCRDAVAAFFTSVYSYIARAGSGIFLIIQTLVLVDVACEWGEKLQTKAEARDQDLVQQGYTPGLCQNGWCAALCVCVCACVCV